MDGVIARLRAGQPGGHPLHTVFDWLLLLLVYFIGYIMGGVAACLIAGQPGSHPLHI